MVAVYDQCNDLPNFQVRKTPVYISLEVPLEKIYKLRKNVHEQRLSMIERERERETKRESESEGKIEIEAERERKRKKQKDRKKLLLKLYPWLLVGLK